MRSIVLFLGLLMGSPTLADVRIEFDEGAPKDRFTVSNIGACPLGPTLVSIDISKAPSGLIFDVTGSGAGVEVFQPFELVSGEAFLETVPVVSDGQQSIALQLIGLPINQSVAFTIDVDDTTSDRQITVSGSEMAGAEVQIGLEDATAVGAFDESANAVVALDDCTS